MHQRKFRGPRNFLGGWIGPEDSDVGSSRSGDRTLDGQGSQVEDPRTEDNMNPRLKVWSEVKVDISVTIT